MNMKEISEGAEAILNGGGDPYAYIKKALDYREGDHLYNCGNCRHRVHFPKKTGMVFTCEIIGVTGDISAEIDPKYLCDNHKR